MAKVFITGSADGLGVLTAKALVQSGHDVILHARNDERARQALQKVPGAKEVLVGDLSSIEQTKELAAKVNVRGSFDVVIHNAGVYQESGITAEGLPVLFVVNTLAPYILSCLIRKPKRLIYLSSDMHLSANPGLDNLPPGKTGGISYSDTKLHDLILTMAVAARRKDVYANAVNPGWVPTKMGGPGAPDSLEKGFETQVWLAESDDPEACVSGHYFYHKKDARYLEAAKDRVVQDKLLAVCKKITGLSLGD